MAGNSLNSLLAWMENSQNNVMWGWSAIAAMARTKTNTLLIQEYIARFTTGSYLDPVNGVVVITDGIREEHLKDFILDAPRLSFVRRNPDNVNEHPSALLTCAILGGVQVTMEHTVDLWRVVKVVETDPLQGPRLTLELNLEDVPGNVAADGRVFFDLQHSDNFKLTFGQTEIEQTLGGDFFRNLFNALPAEKRIWVMGRIAAGGEESLRPESFKLDVQANSLASRNPRDSSYGDGALLICICMVGSQQGGGLPPEYKYLIPDDAGEDYSATVLLASRRFLAPLLIDNLAVGFGVRSDEFIQQVDQQGNLHAQLMAGQLVAQGGSFKMTFTGLDGQLHHLDVVMPEVTLTVLAGEPFRVEFGVADASVRWHTVTEFDLVIGLIDFPPITCPMRLELTMSARYLAADNAEGQAVLQRTDYVLEKIMTPLGRSGLTLSEEIPEPIMQLIIQILAWLVSVPLTSVAAFAAVLARIELLFAIAMPFQSKIDSFVQEHIKLNFGNAIQGDVIRAPRDIGFFGRINPTRTSFAIKPLEPLIAAGDIQVFTSDPAVSELVWDVRSLEDNDTPGLGSISSNTGSYRAPAASAFAGRFHRERVIATDGAGFSSSALVTVLVNPLTINPLIQLCDVTSTVELAAGALSGGDPLWSVKNPDAAEAGRVDPSTLPDGDHTYTPHAKVENKTYVLDEVVVSNGQGSRSAWVLVKQKEPGLIAKPLPTQGLPAGHVQLQAIVNGSDMTEQCVWSLPLNGPGRIDESTGRYIADAAATERFVVIFGLVDGGAFGKFEGHLILALPLGEFEQVLDMMKE